MAILVSDFHDDIRSSLKKYNSAFVSPRDIDLATHRACIDVLREAVMKHESGQEAFSIDSELLKLSTLSGASQVKTLPSDCFKVSSVFLGNIEGDLLTDKEFNDRANSVIIPPSAGRPIATVYNGSGVKNIEILPAATGYSIKYWAIPPMPKYNFTETNGVITYNPTGSIDISMPVHLYSEIFARTLLYLAPASKDKDSANLEIAIQ